MIRVFCDCCGIEEITFSIRITFDNKTKAQDLCLDCFKTKEAELKKILFEKKGVGQK